MRRRFDAIGGAGIEQDRDNRGLWRSTPVYLYVLFRRAHPARADEPLRLAPGRSSGLR